MLGRLGSALVALAAVLAGCIGAPQSPASEPLAPASQEDAPDSQAPARDAPASGEPPRENRTGTLVVTTRMPDRSALAGVEVTIGASNVTGATDASGSVTFERVPVGSTLVTARKAAHRTAQVSSQIAAGATTTLELELAPERDDQHAHEKGVFQHFDQYRFEGHFDCSATYVIVTGDCFILLDNVSGQAGAPARPGDVTSERNLIDFPLDATWRTLVVEMTWDATAPTPATGEGMSLALEPAEAPADGHAAKYARVAGGSPLRVEMAPGVRHETATEQDMPNPEGGEVLRARVFLTGASHNPGGTTFLGVGATVQHDFALVVSIFYGEPAPEGYSGLA